MNQPSQRQDLCLQEIAPVPSSPAAHRGGPMPGRRAISPRRRAPARETATVPAYRRRLYGQYLTVSGSEAAELDRRYYDRWARVARGHFRRLLPEDRHARILDLGCGHGAMLHTLKTLGYCNLVGVDCSPQQIAQARKVHPAVHCADAREYLRAHPGEFAAILAIDLLEHLSRDEALLLLDLCHGALVPGGCVLIQVPNADCLRGLQNVAWDLGHEVYYTPHSLAQILRMAGFQQVHCRPAGPVPHGLFSAARWLVWKAIVAATVCYDLVEMGHIGSKIHTRVMLASGSKAG